MIGLKSSYAGIVMAVIVTLEAFSGRPNPHWQLGAAEIAEFERRLAALPALAAGGTTPLEPLGYRGFSIGGRAAPVHVFHGVVMIGPQAFSDPGRGLERWLLDSGRGSIDPTLAGHVALEIGSSP
ncbi:MAG TPA: hypothetical protein VMU06_18535 [Stellaceae bacterium]|nr:hypothetical protein [Stellaceae bacterium]